eukprot:12906460-Prorocentrum_lima.AAC.1
MANEATQVTFEAAKASSVSRVFRDALETKLTSSTTVLAAEHLIAHGPRRGNGGGLPVGRLENFV